MGLGVAAFATKWLAQPDSGGEGGTLRHFGTIRPFSKKISKSGGLEGYIADYKVDYFS
jgi:hypothetical protein